MRRFWSWRMSSKRGVLSGDMHAGTTGHGVRVAGKVAKKTKKPKKKTHIKGMGWGGLLQNIQKPTEGWILGERLLDAWRVLRKEKDLNGRKSEPYAPLVDDLTVPSTAQGRTKREN